MDSTSDQRTENNVVRHEYRTLTENEKIEMKAIKDAGQDLLARIDAAAAHCQNSRELSLARTKTEEAVMWAVKHITR